MPSAVACSFKIILNSLLLLELNQLSQSNNDNHNILPNPYNYYNMAKNNCRTS